MGKELAKWNKPYVYREFPRMLYMAQRRPDGVVSVGEAEDKLLRAGPGAPEQPGSAELFNAKCQRIVYSEGELAEALERGWRPTPSEALDRFEAKEKFIADAAAHRAHEDRGMSEAARAEVAKVEAATAEHVAEVPEAPRKRGRPSKKG